MVCLGLSAIICVYGMRKLSKVQKVRMWGEGVGSVLGGKDSGWSRGNWRHEAMEHAALMGEKADKIRRLKAEKGIGTGGAGVGGPVLWPGMEGLGMHKLEMERERGIVGEPCGPTVTIHDDIDGRTEERMKEKKQAQRVERAAPVATSWKKKG